GEVDRIEFDMRHGMDERGPALVAAEAAAGDVARVHEPWTRRPAGHADRFGRRCVRRDREFAASECFRSGTGCGEFGFGGVCGEAGPGGFEECVHAVAAPAPLLQGKRGGHDARREDLASSERSALIVSKYPGSTPVTYSPLKQEESKRLTLALGPATAASRSARSW